VPRGEEVWVLRKAMDEDSVTAQQLGVRKLPKGWNGAPLAQLVASARRIVEQSQATGGSGDPRLEAALKVLELKDSSKAKKKK
jgi:hypothetical protein